jgi:hypothetical protein
MNGSSTPKYALRAQHQQQEAPFEKTTGYLGRRVTPAIQTAPAKRLSNL